MTSLTATSGSYMLTEANVRTLMGRHLVAPSIFYVMNGSVISGIVLGFAPLPGEGHLQTNKDEVVTGDDINIRVHLLTPSVFRVTRSP